MSGELTFTEKLAFSTVRIECETPSGLTTGTGFFYALQRDLPLLVTNWHVVRDASGRANIRLNVGTHPDSLRSFHATFPDFTGGAWIRHPDPEVDLAVLPAAAILKWIEESTGQPVYFGMFEESFIPSDLELRDLSAVENVLMVGYPNGLWDSVNNRPIFRRGITATHPAVPYEGRQEFLIDAAVFPGSSGSPIVLWNEGFHTKRDGAVVASPKMKLLGILYGAPMFTAEGEIQMEEAPTIQRIRTDIPFNLGGAIRASRLREFEPVVLEVERQRTPTT